MLETHEQGADVTKANALLYCTVVTPEATVLESAATFVALPLADGEIGIAPGHTPLIGRLGFGELRVVDGDKLLKYYLDGGFVQVSGREVSVLTNRAIKSSEIDEAVVEEQLRYSLSRVANTPELMAQRDKLQLQARAQLRVVRHAK